MNQWLGLVLVGGIIFVCLAGGAVALLPSQRKTSKPPLKKSSGKGK